MLGRSFILLTVMVALSSSVHAQGNGKAFTLRVGEKTFDIDAGETIDILLPDGSKTTTSLARNEFATYSTDRFSFLHPGAISVSRSDLGDGVVQYLLATAIGTMVIIQTYDDIDPSGLTALMLKELTEDDVAAGAKVDQAPATRTVDGKVLNGLKATESLKDDTANYEIVAHSTGDSGVLIITGIDSGNEAEDGPKIAKFWETLKLK